MKQPIRIELPTQYEAGPVNAYLFTDPEPVLVDTGVKSAASWDALVAGLAAQGLVVGDLSRVVLTHAHVDHFGQALRLVQEAGVRLETAVVVTDRLVHFSDYWQRRTAYYRNIFLPQTGMPAHLAQYILAYFDMVAGHYEDIPAATIRSVPVASTITLGRWQWQVLHTPGHCSHQTCFYQPETKQLLASDMLLMRTPTPVVELPPDGKTRQPSLPLFMDSLARIAALDVDIIYPGHGETFTDHRTLIKRQQERIMRRAEVCFDTIRQGYQSAAQIVGQLYADRPVSIQFAGLWMTMGYLDLLLADGRIRQRQENEILLYELND